MHGFERGPFLAIAAQPASLDQSKNDSRQHRQRGCDVSDRREIHGRILQKRPWAVRERNKKAADSKGICGFRFAN